MIIYIADIEVCNPSTQAIETLRVCTGIGCHTSPTDTPANTIYVPRLDQPGNLKGAMFAQGSTTGESQVSFGEIVLINADGALDYLVDYGFDGRKVTVKWGDDASPIRTFTTLYTTVMLQAVFERRVVSLKLRDKQTLMKNPLTDETYQGNNALPFGLEGVADDIKGKTKPFLAGRVFNVTPICVNTSLNIYQFNHRNSGQFDSETDMDSIASFDASGSMGTTPGRGVYIYSLYDQGVVLTRGADYTDEFQIQNTAPTAGQYRVLPQHGCIRLGSPPAGTITADCQDLTTYTDGSCGISDVTTLILGQTSLTDGVDYVQADIDAFASVNSSVVGIHITEASTPAACMDMITSSASTWWGFDRLGFLRLKQIAVPESTPDFYLTENDIQDYERLSITDTENGVPIKRVVMEWRKNYTIQDAKSLAGSVTEDKKAQLVTEYRKTTAEDLSVVDLHPLAGEMKITTAFYDEPSDEVLRILNIYNTRRDRLQVTVKIQPGQEELLNLGSIGHITLNRFGYDLGLLFMLIGFDLNCANSTVTLTLWR